MRYAGLIKNDFTDGNGICVSLYMQGCPIHCPGCHNKQTWDPEGGTQIVLTNLLDEICNAITANGITRNFSVLGGEPLAPYNLENTATIVGNIRHEFPQIKIFLWTGYTYESLDLSDKYISSILSNINYLIDGPFIQKQRDVTLQMRGSLNQRILEKGKNF